LNRRRIGRSVAAAVVIVAAMRFALAVNTGRTAYHGDFYATLPGAYAETWNPTLWNSADLYDSWADQWATYLHGPTQYLTLFPIVFLDSYRAIAAVLLVVYTAVILITCEVIRRFCGDLAGRAVSPAIPYASTLLFLPLLQAFAQREFEVVILLALALAYWAAVRNRQTILGGLLAYIAWFKYAPLLYVPYLVCRRSWRAVAVFAIASIALLGLAHALLDLRLFFNNNVPGIATNQLSALRSYSKFCEGWGEPRWIPTPARANQTNADIRWALCGLHDGGFWIPLPLTYLCLVVVTAAIGLVGFLRLERAGEVSNAIGRWRRIWELSAITIVCSTFFFSHYYYLATLILPLNALAVRFTAGATVDRRRLGLTVVAFLLLSGFAVPPSLFNRALHRDFWAVYMGSRLYLFGELLLLGLVLREYLALSSDAEPA
jgi:hypothetical protein